MEDNHEFLEENQIKEKKPIDKKIKRKFQWLLITFILCSLVYTLLKVIDPFKDYEHVLAKSFSSYFDVDSIMLFCYIFSAECFLVLIYMVISPYIKKTHSISEKVMKVSNAILEWVVILPICAVISTFCFTYLFTKTQVTGTSMLPTIEPDDVLVISLNPSIERFDIVVFDGTGYKKINNKLVIKRVIGLPGDIIEYKIEGNEINLYVNNEQVTEYFFDNIDKTIESRYYSYKISQYQYNESNPSSWAYDVLNWNWDDLCYYTIDHQEYSVNEETGTLKIPEGYYFLLGDNRSDSTDSRVVGLVAEEDIIGEAIYRNNNLFSYDKLRANK